MIPLALLLFSLSLLWSFKRQLKITFYFKSPIRPGFSHISILVHVTTAHASDSHFRAGPDRKRMKAMLLTCIEHENDVNRKQMEDKSTRTDDSRSPPVAAAPSSSSSTAAESAVAVMSNCDVNANKDRFLCTVCSVNGLTLR